MTGNRQTLTDGENYLSRCRVNRHVVEISGATPSVQVRMNGKVSKVIIDATGATTAGSTANVGEIQFFMDVETDGGEPHPYFDKISKLNYTGSGGDMVSMHEVTQGSNQGTANAKNSLHFSVSTTAASESGAGAINEPAAWNGLVCGNVRITVGCTAPAALLPPSVIRVIILTE
jgi:hypothetical protein